MTTQEIQGVLGHRFRLLFPANADGTPACSGTARVYRWENGGTKGAPIAEFARRHGTWQPIDHRAHQIAESVIFMRLDAVSCGRTQRGGGVEFDAHDFHGRTCKCCARHADADEMGD